MSRTGKLVSAKHSLETKDKGGIPMVGNSQLMDNTKFINFNAQGYGGTVSLVDSNTKRLLGITNFDGNKLNTGRDLVFDGVRLLKGATENPTIGNELWIDANPYTVDGAMQNAELVLIQNGNTLSEMPIRDIIGLGMDTLFRELSSTPTIKSNQEFQLAIKFPAGVSIPATIRNYRLEFRCTEAVLK